MGGFSDNYECGYWDEDTTPKKMNKKNKFDNTEKLYTERSDSQYRYLNVLLSVAHDLNAEGQESRVDLRVCNTETTLELVDENKTLKVYYEEVFIGTVQKILAEEGTDNTMIVDDFCFTTDKLKAIEALWNGERFYLREKIS